MPYVFNQKFYFALIILSVMSISSPVSAGEETILSGLSLLDSKIFPEIGYSFRLHNLELSDIPVKSQYEDTYLVQNIIPQIVFKPYDWLKLKAGVKISHTIGGDIDTNGRFSLSLSSKSHSLFIGCYRASLTPSTLYLNTDQDGIPGLHYILSRRTMSLELILARTDLPDEDSYETYIWAGRFSLKPSQYLSFQPHICIYHQAGFDKGGLGIPPPEPSKIEHILYGGVISVETPPLSFMGNIYGRFECDYGGRRGSGFGYLLTVGGGLRPLGFLDISTDFYYFEDNYIAPLGEDFLLSYEQSLTNGNGGKNFYVEFGVGFERELAENLNLSISVSHGFRNDKMKFGDWEYTRNEVSTVLDLVL